MRTRMAIGLLATAAFAAPLGLGVTQAAAAPAAVPQHVVTQEKAANAADGWVLRDKYWTHAGCMEAGHDGIQRQHWEEFQCAKGTLQWVLWTNR